MLLKLGHMKDIVDLLEPALKVKSVSSLSYALHYPERSHKPSSELPSSLQNGESSKRVALFLLSDAPTAYDACQNSASGSLVLSSGDSWHPGLISGCAERSKLHQASYSGFPQ